MGLNIKDDRTHALVRELARRTGTSQTAAVRDAVQQRLDALAAESAAEGGESRTVSILDVAAAYRADLGAEDRHRIATADEWLYDEQGMPR